MSAHAGILQFTPRLLAPQEPQTIEASIAPLGDKTHVYAERSLAMAYAKFDVSQDDGYTHQPLVSSSGAVIAFDGRLDNRCDLLLRLGQRPAADLADADIVLKLYERWSDTCLAWLVGDWSLALWSPREDSLVLAVDYVGNRPVYLAEYEDRVEWSSSLIGLVSRLSCAHDLSTEYLVGTLTHAVPPGTTVYRQIRAIEAAQQVRVGRSGTVRRSKYWTFDVAPIRYRTPEQYAEAFRSLFAAAVRTRLRSAAPVSAELSGGLDSSAVVSMAALHWPESAVQPLHTISAVSKGSPESSEDRFISAVEAHIGRSGDRVCADSALGSVDRERGWASPEHPSGVWLAILEAARRNTSRVLLTGQCGDEVSGNTLRCPEDIAGSLRDGRLLDAFRGAHRWAVASKLPIYEVLADAVMMLTPARYQAKRRMGELFEAMKVPEKSVVQSAATAFLLRAQHIPLWMEEISRQERDLASVRDVTHRALVGLLARLGSNRRLQTPTDYPWVTVTHPFTHRPLVEFVLAIPVSVSFNAGTPRALMRSACACVMPARIIARISKGYAAPFGARMVRQVADGWLRDLDQLHLVRLGLLDPEYLAPALRAVLSGATPDARTLPRIVEIEAWLGRHAAVARERSMLKRKGGENHDVPDPHSDGRRINAGACAQ
jgi:asparagine synthase (glutamine-hydrolysing)